MLEAVLDVAIDNYACARFEVKRSAGTSPRRGRLRSGLTVSATRFATLGDYYNADPRRRSPRRSPPAEWDLGTFWRRDRRQCARITWVRPTREVIAVMQGELRGRSTRPKIVQVDYDHDNPFLVGEAEPPDPESEGPVEVLGSIATARLAEALLWRRRDDAWPTLEDIRDCLAEAPTDTTEIRRVMRRWRAAVRCEQAELDEQRRNCYEVVELARLPADGIEPVSPPPRVTRPCGCYHCRGNWRRIAEGSVAVLERGIDPIDGDAVSAFARTFLRTKRDQRWLVSLFWDPVVVAPGEEAFTNGRHRTHAMRMVGVGFAAIYTKCRER